MTIFRIHEFKETFMHRKNLIRLLVLLGFAVFTVGQLPALADTVVSVAVDTSSIASTPGAEVFFILTDGNGIGDANNIAAVSNFAFGPGTPGAIDALNTTGGVTGNLSAGLSLVDSAFLNVFGQLFTPGTSLSFNLDLTSNVDNGGTPDQFSMIVLDANGNPIPNTDPNGFGDLLVININSANPVITNYASNLVTVGSATTPPPPPVTTPEPSSILLLGTAILTFVALRGRFRFNAGSLHTR